MSNLLIEGVSLLNFFIAPALLLVRFFRPQILPRWAILLFAATLGGITFYVAELLAYDEWMGRLGLYAPPPPAGLDGVTVLAGPGRTEFMTGVVLQLCYLLLWLVPYGVTKIIIDRRKQRRHARA